MPVIRINKSKDYSVMSNVHLRDMNLSLKAKGLLSLMLALPDDWDYSVKGLTKVCKEEETAIENALGELKKYNYLVVKKKLPNETLSGRIEYEYNIFECPQEIEKQEVEFLPLENHPQLNTKIQNTNNINNKKTLQNLVEEKPIDKKPVQSVQTKNEKIINSLIRYVTDFDEPTKQIIKNWLQELYDRKKGISKNALLIALKYLKENYKESEWKSIIEKATLNGWRSFEYCNNQSKVSNQNNNIRTTNETQRNNIKQEIIKNNKKFL